MINKLTTAITLMRMDSPGPEVSLNGSPTVSPHAGGLVNVGAFFVPPQAGPFSLNLLALSQAAPALAIKSDSVAPTTMAPASAPASACAPRKKPIATARDDRDGAGHQHLFERGGGHEVDDGFGVRPHRGGLRIRRDLAELAADLFDDGAGSADDGGHGLGANEAGAEDRAEQQAMRTVASII